jgi:hypothetical protein
LNVAWGSIEIAGSWLLVQAFLSFQLNNTRADAAGPLYLPAGTTIRGQHYNTETSGGVYTTLSYAGTLFDA